MNAGTDRVNQELLGTDVGGHRSIWGTGRTNEVQSGGR